MGFLNTMILAVAILAIVGVWGSLLYRFTTLGEADFAPPPPDMFAGNEMGIAIDCWLSPTEVVTLRNGEPTLVKVAANISINDAGRADGVFEYKSLEDGLVRIRAVNGEVILYADGGISMLAVNLQEKNGEMVSMVSAVAKTGTDPGIFTGKVVQVGMTSPTSGLPQRNNFPTELMFRVGNEFDCNTKNPRRIG